MSTYRDDLAAAQRRVEEMSAVIAERDAELAEARGRLAEHDAVLGKLHETLRARAGIPSASRRGRALGIAAAGVLLLSAAGAFALTGRARSAPLVAASAAAPGSTPSVSQTAPPADPAEPGAALACGGHAGFVELFDGAKTERLTEACGPGRPGFPYAEILEKPDGTPYLIVDACEGPRALDLVGPVAKLPGNASDLRVRLRSGRSERESSSSEVRVTRFGAVGEIVEGEFDAAMRPGLNEEPRTIRGRFSVCRKADRRSP